jgi:uncharacterized coiled-coil protein SlyX
MDGPVTWGAIEYFVAMLVAVSGVCALVWRLFQGNIKALVTRIEKVESEFAAHKMKIAEEYLKIEALERFEAKMLASEARTQEGLRALTNRLDTLLDQLIPSIRLTIQKRHEHEGE